MEWVCTNECTAPSKCSTPVHCIGNMLFGAMYRVTVHPRAMYRETVHPGAMYRVTVHPAALHRCATSTITAPLHGPLPPLLPHVGHRSHGYNFRRGGSWGTWGNRGVTTGEGSAHLILRNETKMFEVDNYVMLIGHRIYCYTVYGRRLSKEVCASRYFLKFTVSKL